MEHAFPALRQHKAQPPILYEAIIFEILSWLPVKSLLQSRTVCKSWKSLISDPSFIKLHLQRSSKNANIILKSKLYHDKYIFAHPCAVRTLFENPESTVISADPSYRINSAKYGFAGSCNGLVCLIGSLYSSGDKKKQIWVRFWNPATRLRSTKSPCFSVHLTTTFVSGFGYDKLTNTYKVVLVFCKAKSTQVKVYSIGDDSWRSIQSLPAASICHSNYGVHISGTLNWLAHSDFSSCKQLVVVSLDLGTETSTQLLLHHCASDEILLSQSSLSLGVLRDCLCLSYDYKGTHFVAWKIMENGVLEYLLKVSYQDLRIGCKLHVSSLLPLRLYENDDILIGLRYSGKLQAIMYNPEGNRVERPKISNSIEWIYEIDYLESLVSPI